MQKHIMALSMIVMLTISFIVKADAPGSIVEIMLGANLDEARGYCLDIAGGKGANAPLDKGLQAHTCYHYTGGILEDQGFDGALISKGQFRISYFGVCMSAQSFTTSSALSLAKCDQSDEQKFLLKPNGYLVTQKAPELCVTVSSAKKKEGRGGSPVHVMRPLTLESCDDVKKTYQAWILNEL